MSALTPPSTQWLTRPPRLALMPKNVVSDLLKIPQSVVDTFPKEKQIIVS